MHAAFEPRPQCARCGRPPAHCWCAQLVSIPTTTRVVLLQHPRERGMAIGTARMASLCLPCSELHVGVDWSRSAALARALSDPERPAALLYPGEGAIDVCAYPPPHPITLVVVDGTWHHAKKIVRINPVLAALPRYAFTPPAPSEYRIRREPQEDYVSTLEALVHVLGALEGDAERFLPMLAPFRAMIRNQVVHGESKRVGRTRRTRRPGKGRDLLAPLRRREGLLCVAAEANAVGRKTARERGIERWNPELVHWVALRVATGERFEALVRPRQPIGPGTLAQTAMSAARFAEAEPLEEALARWRAFVSADDVVCTWGRHAVELLEGAGAALSETRVDARALTRAKDRHAGGSAEVLAALGIQRPPALGLGRGGLRLAELVALVQHLREERASRALESDE